MNSTTKIYNASDFANYHAGTMPANEMHALEKAALDDPFLADALDGYLYAHTPEEDIAQLQIQIGSRQKNANVFPLYTFTNKGWWRIAALLAVIAATGYFFYTINNKVDVKTLAKNEDIVDPVLADTSAAFNNDVNTAGPDSAVAKANGPSIVRGKETTSARIKKPAPAPAVQPAAPVANLPVTAQMETKDFTVAKREDNELKLNEFKGQITDQNGTPVPFASIKEKNSSKGTSANAEGRFFYKTQDSVVDATASAAGYDSKLFNLKKDESKNISLNRSQQELSEVVVTGYSTRKRKNNSSVQKNTNNALQGKVSGVNVQNTNQANTGFVINEDQFYAYLKNYIAPLFDEDGDKLKGEVTLEFSVDKNRRPEKIIIKKSTCRACEQTALQLLQTGPDWVVAADEKHSVLIKF